MKNSFLKGFTWLAVGNLIAKLFGGVYKIILTNIIGGQNIGVYQQLLPVYSFVIVLVSVGVPLGVSKMLANVDDKEKAFKSTKIIFFVYSCILAIGLALCSKLLANGHGNGEYWIVYVLLSPAVILSALSAVYKGYFQSVENFRPTAISNIVEQIAKIVVGLGIIATLVSNSFLQILVAMLAIVIGELASFVVLAIGKKKLGNNKVVALSIGELKQYIKEITKNVLPIMLTGLVLPLGNLIDSFLVIKLLNKTFDSGRSVYLYGLQTGVVGALINIPATISFALISVLMPSLARDYASKNEDAFRYKFQLSFKAILTVAIPCVLFVMVYPQNLIGVVYGEGLNAFNMNGTMISSRLLFWSSFNILFSCLATFFSMCLQSRNCRAMPIVNSVIGMIVKFLLEITFVPSTSLNILSFAIAGVMGNLTVVVLNFYLLTRENINFIRAKELLKIMFSSTIALAVSLVLGLIGLNNLNFVLIIMLAVLVYLLLVIKLKVFDKKELVFLTKKQNNMRQG